MGSQRLLLLTDGYEEKVTVEADEGINAVVNLRTPYYIKRRHIATVPYVPIYNYNYVAIALVVILQVTF